MNRFGFLAGVGASIFVPERRIWAMGATAISRDALFIPRYLYSNEIRVFRVTPESLRQAEILFQSLLAEPRRYW